MNPLNDNSMFNNYSPNQINSQQINQSVQRVKQLMNMSQGNLSEVIRQDPQLSQVLNILSGHSSQSLQNIYMNMCREHNIDPNVILNELRK